MVDWKAVLLVDSWEVEKAELSVVVMAALMAVMTVLLLDWLVE